MTETARFTTAGPAGWGSNKISRLTAATVRQLVTAAAPAVADQPPPADPDSRVVSGLVLPYGGEVGYTDAGPVTVNAGAVTLPAPEALSRIKLMDYHQTPAVAVGYCTALRETPQGVRASFYVARTPDGDRALLEVRERVRDGFSVELNRVAISDNGEVTAADLSAVALVPVPAWASAREDGLAAAASTTPPATHTEGSDMTPEQITRLAELLAIAPDALSDEDRTELAQLLAVANQAVTAEAADDPAPATPAPAAAPAATVNAGLATVPGGLPGGQRQRPQRQVRELFAAQARVLSGTSRPELEAALQDITRSANIWTSGDEYGGQLWADVEYTRRWVPLMTSGELASYKGNGWRWVVKPEVGDYAGDKAAVPSNLPTTEATAWEAARIAGAHDIDRVFFDFGDEEFIAAYYAAMRESYARQSDAKGRAFILARATANGTAGAASSLFRAAAVAAQAVTTNPAGELPVDYFLINATDQLDLLDITQGDVPAYLETFGVTPDKFIPTPGVAAGTVVAGAKAGAKFRELAGSPIKVEAINIANGGVDGGLFGYYATQELVADSIRFATFA